MLISVKSKMKKKQSEHDERSLKRLQTSKEKLQKLINIVERMIAKHKGDLNNIHTYKTCPMLKAIIALEEEKISNENKAIFLPLRY